MSSEFVNRTGENIKKFSKEQSDVLFRIIRKFITEKFIPETKKTAVRLKPTRGKTKAKDTKFGGKPYIPKGFSYPCINGEPMALICQLNFAEIPHLDGYPESGLLQIYLEIDETAMFEPESYTIVYHTDISGKNCYKNPFKSEKQPALTYLDDIFPLSQEKEYKIKAELFEMPVTPDTDGFYELFFERFIRFFTENPDYVSSDSERKIINEFIELLKNDNSSDHINLMLDIFPFGEYDIFEPMNSSSLEDYDKYGSCLVGGFPHFTQGDYRPEGYSELLLQIDSFDYSDGYENTVMWGDGGVINFFIKPESLKNADFSDIYIGGDCC